MSEPHASLTLYSFRRCPFAIRVRLALHEKGLDFAVQEEDLGKLSEVVKALHPEAKVPVLVHGATVVYESAIITEYLEDAYPDSPPLMPRTAGARAEVRLWTYWCNQHFKPAIDRLKYGTSRFAEAECLGAEAVVLGHLRKLEKRLTAAATPTPWLVGDQFGLADIHVVPFCRQLLRITPAPRFLPDFPATRRWVETISQRPAFVRTMAK